MRADDSAALAAKGVIEMYCRIHDCSRTCIFYDREKQECGLNCIPPYYPVLDEES